ncbi:acyl-CoA thioesterase [Deferribacteres bacterium DY0037]
MNTGMMLTKDVPLQIYAYDVDYMGIVHNIVYLRWLEKIRTDFLNEHYSITDAINTGISPIIAKTEMTYHRPVRITDKAFAHLKVEEIGRSKWVISMEIHVEGELYFRADQSGMFYDINKRRPARTPAHVRELFQQALASK